VSYVYFFRPKGQDGPIKIGHSTYPASRLVTYMAWSPVPLEVCAQIKVEKGRGIEPELTARNLERRFHARYAQFRLHHEWFAAHPLLLRDIELIGKGRFRLRSLPAPLPTARSISPAYREARSAPTQRVAA
jgi:hypothetical protein